MKKLLLIATVVGTAITFKVNAQVEMCTGGTMADASKWTVTETKTAPAEKTTLTWNYTTNIPTAGSGGVLRLQATGGNSNVYIWQTVTLKKGHRYAIDAAFKDLGGFPAGGGFWCQFFLTTTTPTSDDPISEDMCAVQVNSWQGDFAHIDVRLSTWPNLGVKQGATLLATADADYSFGFKTGMCCAADLKSFDVVIDNMSLIDLDSTVTTTSVATLPKNEAFEVHPNPADDVLYVSGAEGVVRILDLTGKVLITSKASEIPISSLQPGMYLVKSGNNTRKVLVK